MNTTKTEFIYLCSAVILKSKSVWLQLLSLLMIFYTVELVLCIYLPFRMKLILLLNISVFFRHQRVSIMLYTPVQFKFLSAFKDSCWYNIFSLCISRCICVYTTKFVCFCIAGEYWTETLEYITWITDL